MIRSIFALGKNFKDEIVKTADTLILQQGQDLVGMKCFQAKNDWKLLMKAISILCCTSGFMLRSACYRT